jgi:DNA-3-methyladenine glycosylase I
MLQIFGTIGQSTTNPLCRGEEKFRFMNPPRCPWLPLQHALYCDYHDAEWGVPSRDPRELFEGICLEGAQAGLSWWTVLQKRDHYRRVFHNFQPELVAAMTDGELENLVCDPGIIRHRGKIFSVRQNARAWLALDSPVDLLWSFVGGTPIIHDFVQLSDYPSRSLESDTMSKSLKKLGFNFVGSTTLYAFMQAVGMVDDHSRDCFRKQR